MAESTIADLARELCDLIDEHANPGQGIGAFFAPTIDQVRDKARELRDAVRSQPSQKGSAQ